jgi:hypothetical protein
MALESRDREGDGFDTGCYGNAWRKFARLA